MQELLLIIEREEGFEASFITIEEYEKTKTDLRFDQGVQALIRAYKNMRMDWQVEIQSLLFEQDRTHE